MFLPIEKSTLLTHFERHVRAMTARSMHATPVGGWLVVRAYQPWRHTIVPGVFYPTVKDHRWWSYRLMAPVVDEPPPVQLEWFGALMQRLGYGRRLATALDGFPYRSLYRYDRTIRRNWQWICRAIDEYTQRPCYLLFVSYGHPENSVASRQWHQIVQRMPNLYGTYGLQTWELTHRYRGVPKHRIGQHRDTFNMDDQSMVSDE